MKAITALTIPKFEKTVKVSSLNEMTPDVQKKYVENIAYQAFMWVPCLHRSEEEGSSGKNYYPVIIPSNVTIEMACIQFYAPSGALCEIITAEGGDLGLTFFGRTYLDQENILTFKPTSENMIFTIYGAYPFILYYRIKE